MSPGSTVIPTLVYRDAPKAIDWLCDAFGFQRNAVYADGDVVLHAQLVHGTGTGRGMIMLGSANKDGDWSKLMIHPDETGQRATQSICVIVVDADAHYAQATKCGAQVVIDIADQPYGGRGYACRDLEGHLWWFGTYDPWKDA